MRSIKACLGVVLAIAILFVTTQVVRAQTNQSSYATIVNPVRGSEFWTLPDQEPVTSVAASYKVIAARNLAATWLLRFDALENAKILEQIKQFNAQQELGAFFEITPHLAEQAGVVYRQGHTWHSAGSVFLTGYTPEERIKLIDTYMAKFKATTGAYPASVGAWWIDAKSLGYMKEKYGIQSGMIVADQYATDDYQIWGQYWSSPYYPSNVNALMPASSPDHKLDVVLIQWANRDPINAYGNSVIESTYSVQANDYVPYHNLGIDYFTNLVNRYTKPAKPEQIGQVTVGIENDFSWNKFKDEYAKQLQTLATKAQNKELRIVTMRDFAQAFKAKFPTTNVVTVIAATDPLGGDGRVIWYMSPYYRAGWFYNDKGSAILDMRLYFDHKEEPCFNKACVSLNFAQSDSKALDYVTFGDKWQIDEGTISDVQVVNDKDNLKIQYKNQSGQTRTITFSPRDVSVDNNSQAVSEAIVKAIDANHLRAEKILPPQQVASPELKRLVTGLLLFLGFLLCCIYLPGRALLSFVKQIDNQLTINLLSLASGISLFTLLAYLAGVIGLGNWYVVLLGLLDLYAVIKLRSSLLKLRCNLRRSWPELLLLAVGTCCVIITVIKSGWSFAFGIGFWGPNGHDAIWHLSLIEAFRKSTIIDNPAFAGQRLVNYHFFFDLFVGKVAALTNLNSLDLLFRYVPILIALLYGAMIYALTVLLTRRRLAGLLAIFFAYFGGSFGWVVMYLKDRSFGGETIFWAMQAVSFLLNPPFAISVVLLLAATIALVYWFQTHHWSVGLLIMLLAVPLTEFKVYAGVIFIGAFGLMAWYELIVKKSARSLALSIGLIGGTAVLFLPNTVKVEGIIIFSPFWLIHTMIDSYDRLFWERITIARLSGNPLKVAYAEIVGFILFFVGNLGTRIVGLWGVVTSLKTRPVSEARLFLIIASLIGTVLPLLFIQKATSWNTVQFFYYTMIFFDMFAAVSLAWLYTRIRPKLVGMLIIAAIVLLTLPTSLNTLTGYLPNQGAARVSQDELEALEYLKSKPDGVVMTYPFDARTNALFEAPVPLYAYATTAYVSAFSAKPAYFEDQMNNEIIGLDVSKRAIAQREFFKNRDPALIKAFIKENNIKYIYLPRFLQSHLDEGTYGVKNIYHTDGVNIYEVM